jgi:pimeloyl-ACP methyl ester carboxylesterase
VNRQPRAKELNVQQRVHRATSPDGTEIVGRVEGQGPPLVLVHGAIADGDSEWAAVLPMLAEHFTCYLPSTRGRGLSGHHPDVSREARVADIHAFVESIGEPVAMAGVSGGGMTALGVAARSSQITALAVYEPVVLEAASDDWLEVFDQTIAGMTEAAGRGRPDEAIAAFADGIANDDEQAALASDPEAVEEAARYLDVDIEELREAARFEGPSPTDPTGLQRIDVPVLLLHGGATPTPWFADGCRYVEEHVADTTAHEIPEAGHLGLLLEADRVAPILVDFLASVHQPA